MARFAFPANGNGGAAPPVQMHCIGVDFRSSGPSVRRALALDHDAVATALQAIRKVVPGAEAVVVATCHRTELYVADAGNEEAVMAWHAMVGTDIDGACPASHAPRAHRRGDEAARHLFRVACGLESIELGDNEIAGQLRRAKDQAVAAGTVGPILHRLFDHASRVGRRARATTAISDGGAGVGLAVASALADELAGEGGRVLVVGAGDAGHAVCREVRRRLVADLVVLNRTAARAEAVAERFDGRAGSLDALDDEIARADAVVIAADGLDQRIAGSLDRAEAVAARSTPLVVVDVTAAGSFGRRPGVRALALADLAARRAGLDQVRAAAIPAVAALVDAQVAAFTAWLEDRAFAAMAAALRAEAEVVLRGAAAATQPPGGRPPHHYEEMLP